MVGRMFREAVENLIEDVKDSIEEQGRSSGHSRPTQWRPPAHHLEPPPDLETRLNLEPPPDLETRSSAPEPSVAGPPVGALPIPTAPAAPALLAAATPIDTAGTSEPDDTTCGDLTHAEVDDGATPADRTSDDDLPAEAVAPHATTERAESVVARLEADCEAARDLYRESRAELREARRLVRLAAREERRDRRHERRSRLEVDEAP